MKRKASKSYLFCSFMSFARLVYVYFDKNLLILCATKIFRNDFIFSFIFFSASLSVSHFVVAFLLRIHITSTKFLAYARQIKTKARNKLTKPRISFIPLSFHVVAI